MACLARVAPENLNPLQVARQFSTKEARRKGACMAESDEVREYYAQRNKLILLEARLHDAFCKITEDSYWDSSGTYDIHPAIAHPEWINIKDRIYPSLMIWQIAYMVCPFRDVWHSNNPIVGGYFSERWSVMYEIIDCIECGYINNYQLPPEISNPSQLEAASLDYKVRIKVHFDDLANAIRSGGFAYWHSKWIRVWVAHSTRSKKPKLPFSPPLEPIHVQGIFNEQGFFREVEGKPFELEEVTAPDWTGIKQTYADSFTIWQEKYRHRNIHPVFENQLEWLKCNLNTASVIEIQPIYMAGDPKPPTYKLGEKPQPNTTIDLQPIQSTTSKLTKNTTEEILGECKSKYPVLVDHSKIIETSQLPEPSSKKCQPDEIQWVLKAPKRERDVYFLFERLVNIYGAESINTHSLWAIIFSGDGRLSSLVEIVSYSAEIPTRAIFKDKVANRERDFKWFDKAFKRLFVPVEIKKIKGN